MPTLKELQLRRDDILHLAEKHHATHVRVFGSVARGESISTSDVDILVSFLPGASIFDEVGLWQGLTALLGISVDLSADDTLKPSMRDAILKDAIAL